MEAGLLRLGWGLGKSRKPLERGVFFLNGAVDDSHLPVERAIGFSSRPFCP